MTDARIFGRYRMSAEQLAPTDSARHRRTSHIPPSLRIAGRAPQAPPCTPRRQKTTKHTILRASPHPFAPNRFLRYQKSSKTARVARAATSSRSVRPLLNSQGQCRCVGKLRTHLRVPTATSWLPSPSRKAAIIHRRRHSLIHRIAQRPRQPTSPRPLLTLRLSLARTEAHQRSLRPFHTTKKPAAAILATRV